MEPERPGKYPLRKGVPRPSPTGYVRIRPSADTLIANGRVLLITGAVVVGAGVALAVLLWPVLCIELVGPRWGRNGAGLVFVLGGTLAYGVTCLWRGWAMRREASQQQQAMPRSKSDRAPDA